MPQVVHAHIRMVQPVHQQINVGVAEVHMFHEDSRFRLVAIVHYDPDSGASCRKVQIAQRRPRWTSQPENWRTRRAGSLQGSSVANESVTDQLPASTVRVVELKSGFG